MIINILDLRADHQAVNPIDAAVMGFDQETEKNGVLRAVLNWQHRRIKRDVDVAAAISWAQSKAEPAILMLFDAESTRSELADERMAMALAKQLALSDLGLLVPIGELPIVEEYDHITDPLEASAVQDT